MTSAAPAPDPSTFPDQLTEFTLQGPAGPLEAIADVAERPGARRGVAVICLLVTRSAGGFVDRVWLSPGKFFLSSEPNPGPRVVNRCKRGQPGNRCARLSRGLISANPEGAMRRLPAP